MLITFDDIPFSVGTDEMLEKLGLAEYFFEEIDALVKRSNEEGRPKVVVRALPVGARGESFVEIGEARIDSRLVASLVGENETAYAYVATCGTELEQIMNETADAVEKMWQAQINQTVLRRGLSHAIEQLEKQYGITSLCSVNPGSIPDWPLSEQPKLFGMIGDVTAHTGVMLNDSFLMIPMKSLSGIWFVGKEKYENCSVCLRTDCMGRRAKFDKKLYDRLFPMGA